MKKLIGKIKFRDLLYLIAVSFSLCIFGNILISLFLDITNNPISKAFEEATDDATIIALVISVVVIAPILEELFFRGLVLWLTNKIARNVVVAIIVQAMLFGIAHMNLVQGIYAVGAGIILGYIRVRYETLLASMIVHLLMNVNSLIFGFIIEGTTDIKEKLFIMFITLAIFVLSMYRIILRKEEIV